MRAVVAFPSAGRSYGNQHDPFARASTSGAGKAIRLLELTSCGEMCLSSKAGLLKQMNRQAAALAVRRSIRMLIQYLALHLPAVLAAGGPVDNPAPVNPVGGNGIDLLISYAKYGALAACGLTGVISGCARWPRCGWAARCRPPRSKRYPWRSTRLPAVPPGGRKGTGLAL
jgi:hypothetical protein